MAITNRTVKLMRDWVDGPLGAEYSMGADWDDRWRTGGSVDEVMDEAHLTAPYIVEGIERFVHERRQRLARLHAWCRQPTATFERSRLAPPALTRLASDIGPAQRVGSVFHCGASARGVHRETHLLAEVAVVVAFDDREAARAVRPQSRG